MPLHKGRCSAGSNQGGEPLVLIGGKFTRCLGRGIGKLLPQCACR
jgi:hypothetical protein